MEPSNITFPLLKTKIAGNEGRKLQKSYFDVLGLCCSSEVPLIEKILQDLNGIHDVNVIVAMRTVIVIHDHLLISQIQIVKALNQARLDANIQVYGQENSGKKWPKAYTIACGLLVLVSLFKIFFDPLKWLAVGAVAVGIWPILLRSVAAVGNLRIDINSLMLIAVGGTLAMQDYLEAGTIVFLFTIAEWLESRASHKANTVMSSLMSIAPQKAILAETGQVVDATDVSINTIIAVKAGEVIPIDGIIVEGSCEVDEKTLTGESLPVSKQNESNVWAGTINVNGYISVKTTTLADDCVVAKMAKLVEEAQNKKSKTQRFIDDCAKYYTPAVLLISVGLVAIPAALKTHDLKGWAQKALVVLVSACPCALILSTPVATFCAFNKAASTGLLIKGGDYLEILAKIKVVAFDKTGTITRGEFAVVDFQSCSPDVPLNTLLYWVSSIESKSSHPLASALVDYGLLNSIDPKPEDVKEFQNFPGEGIYGEIDGKTIYIGNKKIAVRAGCESVPPLGAENNEGSTNGYIFSGASLVGKFSMEDVCRSGVLEAMNDLKSLGIRTVMLTGDSHMAAMQVQDQLAKAIDEVHAELLPEEKVNFIKNLKKNGPTAMVGDGVNDAPALATADIGISMGISGSTLATESGHITLMSNDIKKIPQAIRLARKTYWKIVQNVGLSVITKAAILVLAFNGHPLVWVAVLGDVGTCLVVIFNSMLLLRGSTQHKTSHGGCTTQKGCHKSTCAPQGGCTKNSNDKASHGGCSTQKNCHKSICAPQGGCTKHSNDKASHGSCTTKKSCHKSICAPQGGCTKPYNDKASHVIQIQKDGNGLKSCNHSDGVPSGCCNQDQDVHADGSSKGYLHGHDQHQHQHQHHDYDHHHYHSHDHHADTIDEEGKCHTEDTTLKDPMVKHVNNSLDNLEIMFVGSCCRSCRKECGGSLSEIITK